jgi:hypothetical protein
MYKYTGNFKFQNSDIEDLSSDTIKILLDWKYIIEINESTEQVKLDAPTIRNPKPRAK